MVLHKRLDYGSSGYQVAPMPMVPISARGKRSVRKKVVDDKQISAFDLLATVAGELLSERENSPTPIKISETIKKEKQENEVPLKAEVFDQGSCNESTLGSESVFHRQADYTLMEECKLELGIKTPIQVERKVNDNVKDENIAMTVEDPMDLDVKPPALVSSDSSIGVPISRHGSFPMIKDEMELVVDRDDDENSSACTHPSTRTAKAFRPQRIGDRRIRKLLASKFWKVPQAAFKEGELSNADAEMKHVYRSRRMFYTRQRTQRSSFKRRKLFERCSMSDISTSLKFVGSKTDRSNTQASLSGANGASSSSGQKSSYEPGDYNVKFSIKSFKVPELFIEIPGNATVGSLKRTVMETVTAILSGGLRVGILLQGKKVRDDKQTLLQAGISRNDEIENLGFTLEPNSTQPPPPSLTCSEDPNSLLPCGSAEPIQRIQAIVPTQTSVLNGPESDHDSVHSHNDVCSSVDKVDNSRALVPVPGTMTEPLPVVALRKSRPSDLVQRRIRRPFSVAEVEALVQAVEKIGTGRWRDVKIRAFDNAKHRTYVDLKDKWKTLVHTARISPQQRRGEPVPQELLDRVLSAHAYWSQQHAKLQVNPSQADVN